MKMITITCEECGILIDKPLKEITRQRKNGNFNFYCNSECHGKSETLNVESRKEDTELLKKQVTQE